MRPQADRRAASSATRRDLQLEREANDLLFASLAVLGRGEYPFFSAGYLRRLRNADDRVSSETEAAYPPPPGLHPKLIYALMRKARLSGLEADLIRAIARGLELPRAARHLRISPGRASRLLRRATTKMAQHLDSLHASLHEQLAWVLHEEQRRRGSPRETHCKRGQEACRSTGICTRRWYLHQGF